MNRIFRYNDNVTRQYLECTEIITALVQRILAQKVAKCMNYYYYYYYYHFLLLSFLLNLPTFPELTWVRPGSQRRTFWVCFNRFLQT